MRLTKTVIAEVNQQMPRTYGETAVHISQISALVESDRPLLELHTEPFTEMHMRVARNVAALIPDGATLQTGIGGISEAVLHCLDDKRDLGIHTEMCPDGVVDLMESGVMNGEGKTLHRGKAVLAFVLGTKRLFECINDNPSFEFRPISYTNDPFVVAQNERMVAINGALQVDLTGQVCADSLGTRPYSGIRGANRLYSWSSAFQGRRTHHRASRNSDAWEVIADRARCLSREPAWLRRAAMFIMSSPSMESPTCMENHCASGHRR